MNAQLEADALAFIALNPRVWELFVKFTKEVIASGHAHYAVDGIFHRIRWETDVATRFAGTAEGQPLKLNNNHRAYFARKFHEDFPEHAGFFRTRLTASEVVES